VVLFELAIFFFIFFAFLWLDSFGIFDVFFYRQRISLILFISVAPLPMPGLLKIFAGMTVFFRLSWYDLRFSFLGLFISGFVFFVLF